MMYWILSKIIATCIPTFVLSHVQVKFEKEGVECSYIYTRIADD